MSDSKLNIVALAGNDWSGPWMNRQQLLSRLGHRHNVLYSNGLLSLWDRGNEKWRSSGWRHRVAHADQVHIDQPGKLLPRWQTAGPWDRFALRRIARRWRRRLDHEGRPLVAYVFHPRYWPYIDALSPDYLVYHCYDLYRETPGWNSQLENWQRHLIQRANFSVASSQVIKTDLASMSRGPVHFLPNGADYEAFAAGHAAPEPEDLTTIPRPRLAYVGNINRKVDLALLAELARAQPDWQFVMIGGVGNLDEPTTAAYADCRKLANIHWLGQKRPTELPAYVGHTDVNLMAYRSGPGVWTKGIYPLKLHEYLAAGPPVVSAPIDSVEPFSDVVTLATGVDDWQQAIATALERGADDGRDARQSVAHKNSWDARVQRLESLLLDLAG